MTANKEDNFLLERYKYVLSQKQSLNGATLQIITIYQAGLALVVSGQFAISAAVAAAKLDNEVARAGTFALLGLMSVLSTFALLLLVSGVAAWLGYRREEAQIENDVLGTSRPAPNLTSVVTWYETYFGIVIIAVFVSYVVVLFCAVLPSTS